MTGAVQSAPSVCIHGVGRENFAFTMLGIFVVILGLSDVI
jgi:hypothetical protein